MQTLDYWKARQVRARDNYNKSSSKPDREELLMCRRVVRRIETTLFKRSKKK